MGLAVLVLGICGAAPWAQADSEIRVPGDLNDTPDGRVDAADLMLLLLHLRGESTLTDERFDAADLAPIVDEVRTPDGEVNAADLLVLMQLQKGDVGPDAPVLNSTSPAGLNANPISVSGTAEEGVEVHLFVNGVEQIAPQVVGASETFTFTNVALVANDANAGSNSIFAVAIHNGLASRPSNMLTRAFETAFDTRTFSTDETIDETDDLADGINDNTVVWTAHNSSGATTPFQFSGNLTLANGYKLILTEGTSLKLAPGKQLLVQGTLDVQGTGVNAVVFESSLETPQAWNGIVTATSSGVVINIDHAVIRHASPAITLQGSAIGTVLASQIDLFGSSTSVGIKVEGTTTVATVSAGTTIQCGTTLGKGLSLIDFDSATVSQSFVLGRCGRAIEANGDPIIADNTLDRDQGSPTGTFGVYLAPTEQLSSPSHPRIVENRIEGFATGVFVNQPMAPQTPVWPQPYLRFNTFAENGKNVSVGTSVASQAAKVVIDAAYNDWGVSDPDPENLPALISATLDHWMNDPQKEKPLVDFTPFVDETGAEIKKYVLGRVYTDDFDTALPAHEQIGPILFPVENPVNEVGTLLSAGEIPPNVTIHMDSTSGIKAYGRIRIGNNNNPTTVLCAAPCDGQTFQPGAWPGIEVDNTAPNNFIHATIYDAVRAIDVKGAGSFTISNSTIKHFSQVGISFSNGATTSSKIENCQIESGVDPATVNVVGIELVGSSPTISENTIRGNRTGIYVTGGSAPIIGQYNQGTGDVLGNTITKNAWGIWLDRISGTNTVTLQLNTFKTTTGGGETNDVVVANDAAPADLRTTGDAGTLAQVLARRNYWGTTDPEVAAQRIRQEGFLLPVDYARILDDQGVVVSGTESLPTTCVVVGATSTPSSITPGQLVTIQFTTLVAADPNGLEVQIFNELDDPTTATPVRTLPISNVTAGTKSVQWDGKNGSGQYVSPEAYVYVVELVTASHTWIVDGKKLERPFLDGQPIAEGVDGDIPDPEFSPFRNRFVKVDFDMLSAPGRVRFSFRRPVDQGSGTENVAFQVPSGPGIPFDKSSPGLPRSWSLVFDGRMADGNLFDPSNVDEDPESGFEPHLSIQVPQRMKPNLVIVRDTAPVVPNLQLASDPYLLNHSYDQVTEIQFCLSQAADVTVKILKPGESDPSGSGVVATLLDDEEMDASCSEPHTVDWWPDTSEIEGAGFYTFTIEAKPQGQSGPTSLARGVISVRR